MTERAKCEHCDNIVWRDEREMGPEWCPSCGLHYGYSTLEQPNLSPEDCDCGAGSPTGLHKRSCTMTKKLRVIMWGPNAPQEETQQVERSDEEYVPSQIEGCLCHRVGPHTFMVHTCPVHGGAP